MWCLCLSPSPSHTATAEQRVSVGAASAPLCTALCKTAAFQKLSGLKLQRSYGSAGLTVTFCHSCQCRSRRDERNRGWMERNLLCFKPPPLLCCLGGETALLLSFICSSQNTSKFNILYIILVTFSQYFPKCLISLITSNILDAPTKVGLVGCWFFYYFVWFGFGGAFLANCFKEPSTW